MTHQTSTYAILVSPNVKETQSEDGAVLLDVEQGVCFSLNSIGLRIWSLLREGLNQGQIAEALSQEYDVPRSRLLEDVGQFVGELRAKRLVFCADLSDHQPPRPGFWSRIWRRSA